MIYTDEMKKRISDDAKGKIVESLKWDEVDKYWVMTFTDGSEICVRFMAELI